MLMTEEKDPITTKPTFEQLFRKLGMSQNEFARRAGVDSTVVRGARNKEPLQEPSVYKLLNTINELLGTKYDVDDIEGLTIWRRPIP